MKKEGPTQAMPALFSLGRRRRRADVDVDRGVFVTDDLQIRELGVDQWQEEAAADARQDETAQPHDPKTYVEQVVAECDANADRLGGEARDRLSDLESKTRRAQAAYLAARKLAEENETLRRRRWEEERQIDPRIGRFGAMARALLLTFGFLLEAVLIWLATYRFDFTDNQRLIAAVLVGALITVVLHYVAGYLTQQIQLGPSRFGMIVIVIAGGVLIVGVVALLTGLAEIRQSDFPILQEKGFDLQSFKGWLFWSLLMISALGTLSATIAGVAHGIEAPLVHARRERRRAERRAKRYEKKELDAQEVHRGYVGDLESTADKYVEALPIVKTVATRVINEYLGARRGGHTFETNYPKIEKALIDYIAAHQKKISLRHAEIEKALSVAARDYLRRFEAEPKQETVDLTNAVPELGI